MICSNCGNKISEGDMFCSKCGTKIENIVNQESDLSEWIKAKSKEQRMEEKTNKFSINPQIVLGVVVVVTTFLLIYFFLSNNKKYTNSEPAVEAYSVDYNSYLIDGKDIEINPNTESEITEDAEETYINPTSAYNDNPEICTLEELYNIDTEFAVLQNDGMVRPIYTFHPTGELKQPIPFKVNANKGEKLIAVNSINATIYKMAFMHVCPVEIVTDNRSSKVLGKGTHVYIYHFDDIRFVDHFVGTRLPEYDLIDDITEHDFELANGQNGIFFDNIDGHTSEEMVSYIQNNNTYWKETKEGSLTSYYLPAGSHTFGYYRGTDYVEITVKSSIYKQCGTLETDKGNEYDEDIKCDMERTRDGYFIVDIPENCEGMYYLKGENHNKSYCIEISPTNNSTDSLPDNTDAQLEKIDVETEVNIIRDHYYNPGPLDEHREVPLGTNNINYKRIYYYHDGALYFIFAFKGTEEHRFYYAEDQLIRYIDDKKNIFDKGEAINNCPEWAQELRTEAKDIIH